jgi:cysteine-rich repeat protein
MEACGNGVTEPGEICDDGNTANGDGCSANCLSRETCGNSIVDVTEICDDGNMVSGDNCRGDCKGTEVCGDGQVDVGENCDDGDPIGGNCSPDCLSGTGCGNGFVNTDLGEECDDGNMVETDDCRNNCHLATCGDAVINATGVLDEDCDDGVLGVATETFTCNIDCTTAACGDGKVNQAHDEECDTGSTLDTTACDSDCTIPVCGDGHVNATTTPSEQCDPGTVGANVAGCNANCTTPACGDGIVNKSFTPPGGSGPEGCDDGNTTSGDGCSSTCRIESCGNGVTETVNGEQCDDGNSVDTDTCRNNCQSPRCGDGVTSPPETCDTSGNSISCDSDCTAPSCGDGLINAAANEKCDDTNTTSGDGCSSTCQLEPFALAVARTGNGIGTVTSAPAGINCGTDCSEIYLANTVVTLTATPQASSTFNGWTGGGCSGTGTCVVTMSQSRSVTATFEANIISVTKSGTGTGTVSATGISCGIDCNEQVNTGTVVTLTAAPNGDSVFAGWTGGGCSGTGNCVVTVNQATTVNAQFTLNQFTFTVARNGTGTGTVTSSPAGINCGATCSASFTANTLVTLLPASAATSNFIGWSGACTGTGSCAVTMDAAKSVTATFDLKPATLTVNATSGGTVTSTPGGITCGADCTETYTANTSVTLTATPAAGKVFTGWGGDCSGTGTCALTMDVGKTVTATFVDNRLIVTKTGGGGGNVSSSPSGINCGGDCQETYNATQSVTLTATANASSIFTGWSGGGCSGTGACVVTMNGPLTVSANFEDAHTLTVNKTGSGAGTVVSDPVGISCGGTCATKFIENTVVELTATPDANSVFGGWSGAGCSGTGTCTVTLSQARTVTATFTAKFTLTVTVAGTGQVDSSPGGITCGADCLEDYVDGTSVTLTASGGTFTTWSGAPGCSTATTCVVNMTQARSVMASFAP